MSSWIHEELLESYLRDPTPALLAELRLAIRSSPNFSADLDLTEADRSRAAGDPEGAIRVLRSLLPGALLSPSLHARLADCYQRTGHPDAAAREQRIARAALRGIRASGDGSAEEPYVVLRVNDEYDLLQALGHVSARQEVVRHGERILDRHTTAAGAIVHLDVTPLFSG